MQKEKFQRGYWTLENLQTEAIKYSSRTEVQKKSWAAYTAAGRLKLRDAIYGHMSTIKIPNGFWTVEALQAEAIKCTSRQEFQQKNAATNKASGQLTVSDLLCGHMAETKKPKGFCNLENFHVWAHEYDKKVDFTRESRSAQNSAVLTALVNSGL